MKSTDSILEGTTKDDPNDFIWVMMETTTTNSSSSSSRKSIIIILSFTFEFSFWGQIQ